MAAAGVALLAIAVLVKIKNIIATARTGVSVINKFAKTRNDKSNKFANSCNDNECKLCFKFTLKFAL